MTKKNISREKRTLKIIALALIISILSLLIPIALVILLALLFPSVDGYLLTGLCFSLFGSILIIIIPVIFFMLIFKEGSKKNVMKDFIKNHTIIFVITILLFIIIESIPSYRGYTYMKDIIKGPQEAIITNIVIEKKHQYRGGTSYYITGYIHNKKIKLILTGDATSNNNLNAKAAKIYYYKNIREAYDIKYIY